MGELDYLLFLLLRQARRVSALLDERGALLEALYGEVPQPAQPAQPAQADQLDALLYWLRDNPGKPVPPELQGQAVLVARELAEVVADLQARFRQGDALLAAAVSGRKGWASA